MRQSKGVIPWLAAGLAIAAGLLAGAGSPARAPSPVREPMEFARAHQVLDLAEQALSAGRLETARRLVAAAGVPRDERSYRTFRALMLSARLALAEGQPEQAAQDARAALQMAVDDGKLDARLLLAEALQAAGRLRPALEELVAVAEASALLFRGELAEHVLDRIAVLAGGIAPDSPEARALLVRCGRALHRFGRYRQAVALFSRANLAEQTPAALAGLASALEAAGERDRRLQELERGLQEASEHSWPPAQVNPLRLQLADEWLRRGQRSRAVELLQAVLQDDPAGAAAGQALDMLVKSALEAATPSEARQSIAQARQWVSQLGKRPAGTAGWRAALWNLFTAAYAASETATARWALETLTSPEAGATGADGDPAYLYWYARMLDEAGELQPARALVNRLHRLYPLSYYALLAATRWPQWALEPSRAAGSSVPQPDAADPLLAAVLALRDRGLTHEATMELRYLVAQNPSVELTVTLAQWEMALGRFAPAIGRLKGLTRERAPGEVWLEEFLFPRPYREAVENAATAAQLDPLLIYSVMREESLFEREARSAAGAYGLMQLLPNTAGWVASRLGQRAPGPAELFDPEINVRLGAAYLRYLLDRFQDVRLALGAYHAGPGRMNDWTTRLLTSDVDLAVERFPIPATRAYVQKVYETYGIYRRLYGDHPQPQAAGPASALPSAVR